MGEEFFIGFIFGIAFGVFIFWLGQEQERKKNQNKGG